MMLAAVLVGAVAGVVLAVAEAVWLRIGIPSAFPAFGGTIGLLTAIVPRGFVVGAALGMLQGLYLSAADWIAGWCGRRGWRAAHSFAALVAAPLMIGFLLLGQPLLRGREARSLADHPVLLAVLGAAVTWCIFEIVLVLRLAPEWIRARAPEHKLRATWRWTAAGFVAFAASAYVIDRAVLVRLYEPFHWGLRLVTFVSLELAIFAACSTRSRPATARRAPRWSGTAFVVVALGVAVSHSYDSTGSRAAAINFLRLRGAVGSSLVSLADALIRTGGPAPKARPAGDNDQEILPADSAEKMEPLAPGANMLLVTIELAQAIDDVLSELERRSPGT